MNNGDVITFFVWNLFFILLINCFTIVTTLLLDSPNVFSV